MRRAAAALLLACVVALVVILPANASEKKHHHHRHTHAHRRVGGVVWEPAPLDDGPALRVCAHGGQLADGACTCAAPWRGRSCEECGVSCSPSDGVFNPESCSCEVTTAMMERGAVYTVTADRHATVQSEDGEAATAPKAGLVVREETNRPQQTMKESVLVQFSFDVDQRYAAYVVAARARLYVALASAPGSRVDFQPAGPDWTPEGLTVPARNDDGYFFAFPKSAVELDLTDEVRAAIQRGQGSVSLRMSANSPVALESRFATLPPRLSIIFGHDLQGRHKDHFLGRCYDAERNGDACIVRRGITACESKSALANSPARVQIQCSAHRAESLSLLPGQSMATAGDSCELCQLIEADVF